MNATPDISVVMSVYNGAAHLIETCESILSQEGVNLELIVVNDGSTDLSGEMLEKYAARERRLHVIHQANLGLTKALMKGCSVAQAEYIARHDVGDVSQPQRFLLQKAALDLEPDVSFVSSWTEFYGPQWEFLYTYKGTGVALTPTSIISEAEKHGVIDGPCHHGSVMFRKTSYDKCGGYRREFYYGQDWDLWYRLGESGKYQVIPQTLYRVRVFPNSISLDNKSKQTALSKLSLAAMRHRRKRLSENDILAEALRIGREPKMKMRGTRAPGLYFIGECLRRNGDNRSLAYFQESIRVQPFLIKSWIRIAQCKAALRVPEF